MSVYLKAYEPRDELLLRQLSVSDEQLKYVASIEYLLSHQKSHWHYFLIMSGDFIVGFFNLDTQYWKNYEFAHKGEFGVRSFFIDRRFQGKGLAKKATKVLPEFLFEKYEHCPSICLTVNCKNPAAYQSYNAGGFVDTGELYLGGSAGPQHIMRVIRY
jgi:RimJ/RimL family protein N-acetyltransferase